MTKNNNCNDYTALGNYWINSNDVAITITNLPTPKAGTLKVESGVGITGSYILQTYRTYDGYEIWQRARSNLEQNGWYGWVQLMTSRILSLDCIKTTVSTVANTATTIPNSPTSKNYIPVVVGHKNTNNCLENIFQYGFINTQNKTMELNISDHSSYLYGYHNI